MIRFFKILLLLGLLNSTAFADGKNSYKVLCYHNVVDKITDPKIMNVTTDQLISHFKWLKVNGYNVISLDDIINAKNGKKDLPQKAVLLTFDDGYVSFYTRIYPLLKLYNYHGVYALVGKWQETPEDQNFLYGTLPRSRKMLLSWDEVNEMKDSGLIEFASHTYDYHHGIIANPQGNTQPALTALKYDAKTARYESTQAYLKRVDEDIKKSSDIIYKYTGQRPRSIAWPYGAYNGTAQKIASKYDMPISLTLDDGSNTPKDIAGIKRILIENNPGFEDFYWSMQKSEFAPQRSLFIDIDNLYDINPKKADLKLGHIIEYIKAFGISTIVLKAYGDQDDDGIADTLYFPNQLMPMRSDLLNRVAWQIKSRGNIEDVFIQMPITAFEINNKTLDLAKANDQRKIMSIYSDMAKYSFFKGILFDHRHSDSSIRTDDIVHFTDNLLQSMRDFTIHLKTSIMIDAKDAMKYKSHDVSKFLSRYDYTFLDTQNLLNRGKNKKESLTKLVDKIKQNPHGLEKSAFIFTDSNIAEHMNTLILQKALNFGYQPKKVINNNLNIKELIKVFSLKSSPFE